MDIGTIVAWLQAIVWLVAAGFFLARILTGKVPMPKWFSSNTVIGVIIALGLVASAISMYLNYRVFRPGSLTGITVSAYGPDPATLTVIQNETFENADIPLDGHSYNNVTFVNCCFLYDGGAYQLQNVTVKDHWRVCVKDERLKNQVTLLAALRLMSAGSYESSKSVVLPKQPSPQSSKQP